MANQGLNCALSSDYDELLMGCAVIDEPSSDKEKSKWLVQGTLELTFTLVQWVSITLQITFFKCTYMYKMPV